MKLYGVVPVLLMVSLLAGADAPKNDVVKQELAKLKGTWEAESFEAEGRRFPKGSDERNKLVYVFEGDSVLEKFGARAHVIIIRIDPTKSPKTIDMTPKGDTHGQTIVGIYHLDKDSLTLAQAYFGSPRPTKFVGGRSTMLRKLKRVKP